MSTWTAISRMLFVLCMVFGGVKEVDPWVEGSQPFPEGEATVLVHRFCWASNCDYSDLTGRDWTVAIQNAARAWSNAGSNFRFSFESFSADANHDPCQPWDGHVYVILTDLDTSLCGYVPPKSVAGGIIGGIADIGPGWARVYINSSYISSFIGPRAGDIYDPLARKRGVQKVLLHEFGHVVGLGHPDEAGQNVEAVMNSTIKYYPSLQPDDIAGIRSLYGTREAPTGFLENPGDGSSQSGVGIISGWVCEAEEVEIEINGTPQVAAYGTERLDTQGVCGDSNNGFALLFNWNLLGNGTHTVRTLADDQEFGRATFTVTTLGTEFLRGVSGGYWIPDFPQAGQRVGIVWQQASQNFVITEYQNPALSSIESAAETTVTTATTGGPRGTLENPSPASFQSGIGLFSGWVCDAQQVEIDINGTRLQAGYGTIREDTAGVCGDTNNGFGLLFNWNRLGDGQHTVRALADGREFGRATFTVTTLGTEFLRGVSGGYWIPDFPQAGQRVGIVWQQASQNFVIVDYEDMEPEEEVIPPARLGFERIWGTWEFGPVGSGVKPIGTFTWRPRLIEDTYAYGTSDAHGNYEPTEFLIVRYPDASDPPPVADYEYVASWRDSSFCYQYAFSFTDNYTTEGGVWRQRRSGSSCPNPFSGSRYDVSAYR